MRPRSASALPQSSRVRLGGEDTEQGWALGCAVCAAVLRCPQDPCIDPAPPSASRHIDGSVHLVLLTIRLRAVGRALRAVSPQISELKAAKPPLLLPLCRGDAVLGCATVGWPVVHRSAALLRSAPRWQSRAFPPCAFCALGQVLSVLFQWMFLGIDLSHPAVWLVMSCIYQLTLPFPFLDVLLYYISCSLLFFMHGFLPSKPTWFLILLFLLSKLHYHHSSSRSTSHNSSFGVI